jgi:hypothetical protein
MALSRGWKKSEREDERWGERHQMVVHRQGKSLGRSLGFGEPIKSEKAGLREKTSLFRRKERRDTFI